MQLTVLRFEFVPAQPGDVTGAEEPAPATDGHTVYVRIKRWRRQIISCAIACGTRNPFEHDEHYTATTEAYLN